MISKNRFEEEHFGLVISFKGMSSAQDSLTPLASCWAHLTVRGDKAKTDPWEMRMFGDQVYEAEPAKSTEQE